MGEKLIEAKGNFIQWPLRTCALGVHLAAPPECSFLSSGPALVLSCRTAVLGAVGGKSETQMPMSPLGTLVGSENMAGTQGSLAACSDVT